MLRGSGKPKKQFSRPSVTVSTDALGDGAKKAWQDLDPRQVEVGDLILGKGLVVGLGEVSQHSDPFQYRFVYEMKNGTEHVVYAVPDVFGDVPGRSLTTIRAFARVRG